MNLRENLAFCGKMWGFCGKIRYEYSSPCSRRTAPSTTLSAIERPQVRHSRQSQQKHPGTPRRPFWPQTLPASTTAAATTTDTVRPPQHDSPQSSIRRNRFLGQRSAGVRSVQPRPREDRDEQRQSSRQQRRPKVGRAQLGRNFRRRWTLQTPANHFVRAQQLGEKNFLINCVQKAT